MDESIRQTLLPYESLGSCARGRRGIRSRGGNQAVVNAAGFFIHPEVHKARPDVIAAAHAHSVYGKA